MSEELPSKPNPRSSRPCNITVVGNHMTITVTDLALHRNGVDGIPFHVALFSDPYGLKVGILFTTDRHCAVLALDQLAEGDIRFGSNSWRGDWYEDLLREAVEIRYEETR